MNSQLQMSSKLDEESKIIDEFKIYCKKLNDKNDRYERIVKLSRDITIESKRIIFLLHTIDRESKKAKVLKEAEERLEALISKHWKSVAKELNDEDPYLYHKAFSPGMQEFIEAFTYFSYLKTKYIFDWSFYQNKLKYDADNENATIIGESKFKGKADGDLEKKKIMLMTLVPLDFFLGLADLTGEMMRKCINSLGAGNPEESFNTCSLVKNLYSGFLSINIRNCPEMFQKMTAIRQNLLKMEMACYNNSLRKREIQ